MITKHPGQQKLPFRIAGYSSKLTAISLAISFGVIGTALLMVSHAGTSSLSVEPEGGTLASPATLASDATASNSKYIQFGSGATPPPPPPVAPPPPGPINGVSSATPCVGAAAPAHWNHVVVLMFENQTQTSLAGNTPWTSSFFPKCGNYTSYHDANYTVSGGKDGSYNSKPQYAVLTNGLPATATGFNSDNYTTVGNFDNIYNRLNQMGKTAKNYVDATGGNCSIQSSGMYHDPMRYYTDLGGQSTASTTYCNQHDVNIAQFMPDVNSGKLPAFSMIIPTNNENMHSDTWTAGDAWAKAFLTPLLDSAQYKSGDTAVFWLWDEDTPTPNAFIAPSIKAGSHPVAPSATQPIGHYSMLRTWEDMLGITPYLGNTGQASSILNFYNGH